MAPDLNSVPVSPRPNTTTTTSLPSHTVHPGPTPPRHPSTPASRRASQIHAMSPPPLPLASPSGALPTHAFPPLSPNLSGHPSADAGHAPIRHPRPLTAAELHLELEKEQEAVVNRLTRELSALRAHSASVASTASSLADNTGDVDIGVGAGGMFHSATAAAAAARRERRSSSSVSRSAYGGLPHSQSQSQNRSQRQSISSQQGPLAGGEMMRRSSSIVSTPRYEEVALQQAVLEEVKRENEKLKERIRELERAIRGRGEEAGRERGRTGAPGGGADAQPAAVTASSAASTAGAETQS